MFSYKVHPSTSDYYTSDQTTGLFSLIKLSNGNNIHYKHMIDLQLNYVEMWDGLMSLTRASKMDCFLGYGHSKQYQVQGYNKGVLL
jgi:hypothetical protein